MLPTLIMMTTSTCPRMKHRTENVWFMDLSASNHTKFYGECFMIDYEHSSDPIEQGWATKSCIRNAPFKKEDGHQKCIMNALHDPTHQEEFRCRKNKMVE